jgi:hypothetical protein
MAAFLASQGFNRWRRPAVLRREAITLQNHANIGFVVNYSNPVATIL